jgi:hypothetical protein
VSKTAENGVGAASRPSWKTVAPRHCPIKQSLSHGAELGVCDGAHYVIVMKRWGEKLL